MKKHMRMYIEFTVISSFTEMILERKICSYGKLEAAFCICVHRHGTSWMHIKGDAKEGSRSGI